MATLVLLVVPVGLLMLTYIPFNAVYAVCLTVFNRSLRSAAVRAPRVPALPYPALPAGDLPARPRYPSDVPFARGYRIARCGGQHDQRVSQQGFRSWCNYRVCRGTNCDAPRRSYAQETRFSVAG